ncbi:hypothetical protein CALCODRAFT_522163, partial [Calocera cornea HHB12733]
MYKSRRGRSPLAHPPAVPYNARYRSRSPPHEPHRAPPTGERQYRSRTPPRYRRSPSPPPAHYRPRSPSARQYRSPPPRRRSRSPDRGVQPQTRSCYDAYEHRGRMDRSAIPCHRTRPM